MSYLQSNYYEIMRNFWDWCFENPEKIRPPHISIFCFAVEHCNRLGWKQKFGFPTTMAMEATGIKSYNTFINALKELVEFGHIEMIEKSKNQYSANIIALSKNDKALDKALDKAFIKHKTKQSESTIQSIDSIDIQYTIEQINKYTTNFRNHHKNEFEQEETKEFWNDWVNYRFDKYNGYNVQEQKYSLAELKKLATFNNKLSENNVRKLIEVAIRKGWKDFYYTDEMKAIIEKAKRV